MWQEDAPLGLSSLYIKCGSAEFYDSLSTCLVPTSCLWQVLSNTSEVRLPGFRATVLSFQRNLNFPPVRLYYLSIHFCHVWVFFIFSCTEEVYVSTCVCLAVSMSVSVWEPTWQCTSGIQQNATYHLGTRFFSQHVAHIGAIAVYVCVSIIETVCLCEPLWLNCQFVTASPIRLPWITLKELNDTGSHDTEQQWWPKCVQRF